MAKDHTSLEEFSLRPSADVPTESLRGSGRLTGVPKRRGYAPSGLEAVAPVIVKSGDGLRHVRYAPIPQGIQGMMTRLRGKLDAESRTDIYCNPGLPIRQVPADIREAVAAYRQLAARADTLNQVPQELEVQMNSLYDAIAGYCREVWGE